MNGPSWLYRVKVSTYRDDNPHELARVECFYTVDVDEARRLYREWAARGCGVEFSSAVVSDFYRISVEDV
ncbi:hypothetical protein ABT264_19425 [Streptomyces virginiae]|uniref:hypothetical protein n=1 Tax=Streptomyces virginiae TaxID=1961 RepID=UPI00332ACE57